MQEIYSYNIHVCMVCTWTRPRWIGLWLIAVKQPTIFDLRKHWSFALTLHLSWVHMYVLVDSHRPLSWHEDFHRFGKRKKRCYYTGKESSYLQKTILSSLKKFLVSILLHTLTDIFHKVLSIKTNYFFQFLLVQMYFTTKPV